MQGEVQGCVAELDKLKKVYVDDEHVSHDARDKAREAEEKYVTYNLTYPISTVSYQYRSCFVMCFPLPNLT